MGTTDTETISQTVTTYLLSSKNIYLCKNTSAQGNYSFVPCPTALFHVFVPWKSNLLPKVLLRKPFKDVLYYTLDSYSHLHDFTLIPQSSEEHRAVFHVTLGFYSNVAWMFFFLLWKALWIKASDESVNVYSRMHMVLSAIATLQFSLPVEWQQLFCFVIYTCSFSYCSLLFDRPYSRCAFYIIL